MNQLVPGSAFYNINNAVPLDFAVDSAVLERSLNEISRRHETLRTTFRAEDGLPLQIVASTSQFPLRTEDLSKLGTTERDLEVSRLSNEEARAPFNLETGPLIRSTLLVLGPSHHLLLVTFHHIIADAWSLSVFYRELAEIYEAFALGRPSPLPELEIQYADFSVWQTDWLSGQVLEEQLGFWRDHLCGASTLALPTDRPRPSVNTFQGASHRFSIRASMLERLELLSQREGCTLFMTLLATFYVVLHRYTSQSDLVVGVPVAGRNQTELEQIIGFFVNTLAIRVEVPGATTFRQLLCSVREVFLEAAAHQELPFEKIVEELQPVRDMSRNPIYQVTFQLHNVLHSGQASEASSAPLPTAHRGTSNFDIAFDIWPQSGALMASLDYSTDLFDASTISRLGRHFLNVLEAITHSPDVRVADVVLAGEDEVLVVTQDWNATTTEYPSYLCVHELFEAAVDRDRDALALTFGQVSLSYAELDRRANRVASGLRRCGVEADCAVGICLERSVELVVGLLGILKAGGGYVALDPSDPPSRTAFALAEAGCRIVLTQESLCCDLRELADQVIALDATPCQFDTESDERLPAQAGRARPETLAYISFTSGTTGQSKGACILHRGIVNLVHGCPSVDVASNEVMLQISPVPFDASTFEIWGCLTKGARLVITPPEQPSLDELGRLIASEGVTTLFLTTGLFHQMVDNQLDNLLGVQRILTGGDVLSADHARRLLGFAHAPSLTNCYGPTECTMFVTCWHMTVDTDVDDSVPIGRPIANTRIYVLDEAGNALPIGIPGELFIAGGNLARGYCNQQALTEAAFIPDQFSSDPDARLYRTGDLVRYRADGSLVFLGRVDRQLKVRGYRVEPAQVEAALSRHPGVREVTVQSRIDPSGTKTLCAYIAPNESGTLTSHELHSFLQNELPHFMLPSELRFVDAVPRTRRGKVDVAALPDSSADVSGRDDHHVPPVTEIECALVPIWEEVLGVARIGIKDNFFSDLPGHSLLATLLVSRICSMFQIDLPLRKLFEAPDICRLALIIEETILDEVENLEEEELDASSARPAAECVS